MAKEVAQEAWTDGGFPACDNYIRVRIKDPNKSKYLNWWLQNGGSLEKHFDTQAFVENYDEFFSDNTEEIDNDEIIARSEVILHGSKNQLANIFLDSPIYEPQEFFAKVNELRVSTGKAPVTADFRLLKTMELEKIKKESHKFRSSLTKLVEMGFDLDEIRYSKNMEEMLQKYLVRNPDIKLEETEDEFFKLYHEALDYIDRYDHMMLIQLELNPSAKNFAMLKKREKDYQLLNSCGFTKEDLVYHKDLIRKLQDDPATMRKAYRLLQASGKVNDDSEKIDINLPETMEKVREGIKKNYRYLKYTLKTGFWIMACAGCLTTHFIDGFSKKKSKKNCFSRFVRKHPFALLKQYKKEVASDKKTKAKKLREIKQRENEFLKQRLIKDYKIIKIEKFFNQEKVA